MKQRVDRLWVLLLLAAMLLSLGKAIVRPKDINYYENRPAAALPAFTVSGLLAGEDQDALEQALSDQTVGAQGLEQRYHRWTTAIQKWGLRAFMSQLQGRYVAFQGMQLFDDYIVYSPIWPETEQPALAKKAENYNAVIAAHPELDFYAYFIEKDTDLDLESGVSTGASEDLLSRLDILVADVDKENKLLKVINKKIDQLNKGRGESNQLQHALNVPAEVRCGKNGIVFLYKHGSIANDPIDIQDLIKRGPKTAEEKLRVELYDKINRLGIGAQGLGGKQERNNGRKDKKQLEHGCTPQVPETRGLRQAAARPGGAAGSAGRARALLSGAFASRPRR